MPRLYLHQDVSSPWYLMSDQSQLVRIQSAYLPGYNAALASSIRDGPLRNLAPQFTALGRYSRKTNGSVLVIWVRHGIIL